VCTYVREANATKNKGGIQVLFKEYCTKHSFYPKLLDPCDPIAAATTSSRARAPRRAEGQTSRAMRAQRYDTHVTKSCAGIPTKPTVRTD